MEELSVLFKTLDLEQLIDEPIKYNHINVFKNPNKLPINQVHLEKVDLDLRKDTNLDDLKWGEQNDSQSKYFDRKVNVIPALSKSWLPPSPPIFSYEPYNFTSFDNFMFIPKNQLFSKSLSYLLECNYHQFWCLVLFEPQVIASLHSFLLNPVLAHEIQYLGSEECIEIYKTVFTQVFLVYRRLLTFKQSQVEHMPEDVGLNYLLDKKLINLPIVITLILLYKDTDLDFINALVSTYFSHESAFRDKEIEEMLSQSIMTLEMIGGHVCGFEPNSVIVPIAVEERPPVFSLSWVYSVVNYLFYTITTLGALLKFHKPSIGLALDKGVPYRLSYTYERVYSDLYIYIEDRPELEEDIDLADLIYEKMALGRSEFIDVYNSFVTYCLDECLKLSHNPSGQEQIVETYLKLMTSALEDEYFICDYHETYDVGLQNEMFNSCCNGIDETRTAYILTCIQSFHRYSRLENALTDPKNLMKVRKKYARTSRKNASHKLTNGDVSGPDESEAGPSSLAVSTNEHGAPSEEEIEDRIRQVIDMFPHLGDGFVLRCLEVYNYQPSDVISAILEENLPPHILDIPFDEIRIPPEPKPEEPILAYRGKKPDYDDALKLLNDKRDMKEIKTFILDGIQYTNQYDVYDDEYDDRLDEEITVQVRDHHGSEDILKFTKNPNYESGDDDEAVSDTSYSDNEYDERGQPVVQNGRGGGGAQGNRQRPRPGGDPRNKPNFCEDPAVLRERREQAFRGKNYGSRGARGGGGGGGANGTSGSSTSKASQSASSKGPDVVGKPKGQGQEKNVERNRQKKNANKSSRANHNRKGGAQFKRTRGMVPS